MSHSKAFVHCQKGFNLKPFFYQHLGERARHGRLDAHGQREPAQVFLQKSIPTQIRQLIL